jgi:hypothetical protein
MRQFEQTVAATWTARYVGSGNNAEVLQHSLSRVQAA